MSEETKTEEAPQLEGKMAEFVDWIETISVLELSKLVKALEDRLGVSAAAPAVAMAAPAVGGGDAGAAAEEQTEFDVILNSPGGQKIAVIKELRAITGAGLKEAKEMAETADAVVKEGASKEEAEEIKSKLEGAGASVTVK
jgi:large subunit ribosomal protein L7/L12